MTLEKKLVRLRKKEGMSQADVSEKLDVSRQAVSRWEPFLSKNILPYVTGSVNILSKLTL